MILRIPLEIILYLIEIDDIIIYYKTDQALEN